MVSSWARAIWISGMDWPNEIVASHDASHFLADRQRAIAQECLPDGRQP